MFFDARHGSSVRGASNAEPQIRMDSDIAVIENWELPAKVVSAGRKTSTPLLLSSFVFLLTLNPKIEDFEIL